MFDASSDALLPVLDKSVSLPNFEGPLDLLLFLIRKDEIDIHNIPIETVLKQYLGIIYQMESLDLELAGEFFVMASTLMYIKSRMLVPSPIASKEEEDAQDALDPRWELVEQLLEYKRYKELSIKLEDSIQQRQDYLPRLYIPPPISLTYRPIKEVDKMELWSIFNQLMLRLSEQASKTHIYGEVVTVSERMQAILERLERPEPFFFSALLPASYSLSYLVATFLGVLELCRLKKITLKQSAIFEDIECSSWQAPSFLPPEVQ